MNPQEKEQTRKLVVQFIAQQSIGIISTVAQDSTPEAATVSFFMDMDWTLYVRTHVDSRKAKNISTNPNVAFVVGTTLIPQTVQIQGVAEILSSTHPDYQVISEKMRNSGRFTLDPILHAYAADNYVIIRIKPTWIRYLKFDQIANKENYTVILP